MAIGITPELVHLPFGERPQYGQPYPEGMAMGFAAPTGDATGGDIVVSFIADPGKLYRLELVNMTRGSGTTIDVHMITTHEWARARSGAIAGAWDLNWELTQAAIGTFSVYVPSGGPSGQVNVMELIRRVPMGRTSGAPGVAQQLLAMTMTNVNNITHEVNVACTYWDKSALYLPGFLSAFFEAPAVPPLIRLPT